MWRRNWKNMFNMSFLFVNASGIIMSLDDFYLASSGLAAMETTLFVYNKELFRTSESTNMVFEAIRVVTALRLANNAQEWIDTFTKYNRYFYIKQWISSTFHACVFHTKVLFLAEILSPKFQNVTREKLCKLQSTFVQKNGRLQCWWNWYLS